MFTQAFLGGSLHAPQVKKFLMADVGDGRTVLHEVAHHGDLTMWACVVDVFEEQGLLNEVSSAKRERSIMHSLFWLSS